MADIICRWRNATPKTVCEFVEKLPHKKMSAEDFRFIMQPDFFRTAYQLACQLGLYYEDKDVLIRLQAKEIERLNNIIKEVREYIQDRYDGEVLTHTFDKDNVGELLEILGSEKE